MKDLVIGGYNTLEATGENRDGLLLASPRGDILLPTTQVGMHRIGEKVRVFIHNDSDDGLVAATLEPRAMVGDIACLKVTDSNHFGAFLDWGLPKDLLCPKSQQQKPLNKGDMAVVKVCLDPENERIFGNARLREFFEDPLDELKRGQEVDIIGLWHSDLGFNVLIENRFGGLIHRKEMLDYLEPGYRGRAWVKEVRHDGGVSISLKPKGFSGVVEANDRVLNALEKCGGRLPLDDNSDPELIQQRMKMSKKTFKKAIGNLMRLGLVKLEKHGITRTDKPRHQDTERGPYGRSKARSGGDHRRGDDRRPRGTDREERGFNKRSSSSDRGYSRKKDDWRGRDNSGKRNDWKNRDDSRNKSDWKGRDDFGKRNDWKGRDDSEKRNDWKNRDDSRNKSDWKNRDDSGKRNDWKGRDDSEKRNDWENRDDSRNKSDWKSRDDSRNKSDWKKKEEREPKRRSQSFKDRRTEKERYSDSEKAYSGKPRTEKPKNAKRKTASPKSSPPEQSTSSKKKHRKGAKPKDTDRPIE